MIRGSSIGGRNKIAHTYVVLNVPWDVDDNAQRQLRSCLSAVVDSGDGQG